MEQVLEFVQLLRKGGMNIAYSEMEDAIKGLTLCGFERQEDFYTVLAATLCKDECDRALFDMAYRLHFLGQSAAPLLDASIPCDGDDGIGQGNPSGSPAGMTEHASAFYGALIKRDAASLENLVERAARDLQTENCSLDELLHQIKTKLGWFMVENTAHRREDHFLTEQLTFVEKQLRQRLEDKIIAEEGDQGMARLLEHEDLQHMDLASLSERQIAAMERRIAKLGHRLAARYSYRLKMAKHGSINMRKLLSETAKRGSVPAHFARLDKAKDRPDLVVLCDISGSVSHYSAFFMQLLCAMARRFRHLRTFLFVDDVAEVFLMQPGKNPSELVREAIEASHVVRTGVSKHHCSRTGISDYGKVFTSFRRQYDDIIGDETTVMLLGDARNNWFSPGKEEFARLAKTAQKLIWLNPEPKHLWNDGDSIIGIYAPYCHDVIECGTLSQLERAMSQSF